jgi:type VI secretion system protein ImpK
VLVGIYVAFSWSLSGASDALASQIASIRLARPQIPERPERPRPVPEPRLAPFLAEEISKRLVSVEDRTDRSVVTILGDGLFKPGEPSVGNAEHALLGRIADALTRVNGQVEVVGHSDNVPIRTLRFPSNFELSKARAESVSRLLTARLPPARVRAEGRGDTEPLAANDTPAGRARNRRVEIILYVPSAGSPDTLPTAPAVRS